MKNDPTRRGLLKRRTKNPPEETLRIVKLNQLGGHQAEILAARITSDLMEAGFMRSSTYAWDDEAHIALKDGQVVGLIAWRVQKWNRSVFISLGGVHHEYRRHGIYRKLFEALVQHHQFAEPRIVERIDSGHHIRNVESQKMHEALGRRLDGLSYVYEIPPRNPPEASGLKLVRKPVDDVTLRTLETRRDVVRAEIRSSTEILKSLDLEIAAIKRSTHNGA